ncbi:hypothetical protein EPO33_04115 [Patescibacteria group bacterium]|nr:MAG: hypothetical protein EPO33_04115 [Patescibacteria group bacterium]
MRFLPERRSELRFAALVALALVALAALPELAGRILAAPSGTLPFIGSDTGVYYAYIEQVRQGHWLLRDVFTTEPQPHRFLNLSWLAVGLIARVTQLGPEWIFPFSRLLSIPVAVGALVFAGRTFLDDARTRRVFLLLAAFGAGWGAWWVVGRSLLGLPPEGMDLPIDLWVPEATLLLSALSSPHFVLSLAALVTVISADYRFARTRSWRWLGLAAAVFALLGQFHPYYVPVVLAVSGAGWLALAPTGKRFWALLGGIAVLCAAGLLGALPYGWLSLTDVTTLLRNSLNQTPMPGLSAVLVAAGAFLPLALITLWRGRLVRTPTWRFLAAWLLVHAAFVYAPIPWQRKMTEGLLVPLALLVAPELLRLWEAFAATRPGMTLGPVRRVFATASFFLLFAASGAMNLLSTSAWFTQPFPVWISAEDRAAMSWIRKTLPEDAVIVAVAERANGIAAMTARTVYAGHWAETVAIESKLDALVWLAGQARDDAARHRFLRRAGVTHVYIGPLEREVWKWEPSGPGFHEIYRAGQVAIFAVEEYAGSR